MVVKSEKSFQNNDDPNVFMRYLFYFTVMGEASFITVNSQQQRRVFKFIT